MSATDKISLKEIIAAAVVLVVIGSAMFYTLSVFNAEGVQKPVDISQAGDKEASHVETHAKLVSIDPIKGDLATRFEFEPSDNLLGEDGTLKQDLKLYVNAANGKQEFDFPKGKLMSPIEATFNMHDGQATEYPFDKYAADIDLYIMRGKTEEKKKTEAAPKPAADDQGETAEKKDEAASEDMALSVDFLGSLPGYKIEAKKAKYTEADYVGIAATVERSGVVKFFSMFVNGLMWLLTIGVLLLVISLFARGRKVEIAMFSFTGALLFGFYAIRNSQPNIPPIGVYSDFLSYIWCEVIIGLCLAVCVIAWVLRPTK